MELECVSVALRLNTAVLEYPKCTRGLQVKSASDEQGAGWSNMAHFLLSFSKPSNVRTNPERLTFEPRIHLTEMCWRDLKGQKCLQSLAFVVSFLAVVISAKCIHLERSALH
jgi:hypothetical protein